MAFWVEKAINEQNPEYIGSILFKKETVLIHDFSILTQNGNEFNPTYFREFFICF